MDCRIFGLLLLVTTLTACDGSRSSGEDDPIIAEIAQTGAVRAGYITYPPSFITDPNTGQHSGISYDVLVEISNDIGFELVLDDELSFGSMVEAVQSGRVRMVATGIWPTDARRQRADFSEPIFYSPVYAYVRFDDERFDGDLSRINNTDVAIAVIDGEMSATIASEDFNQARTSELPQLTGVGQLLLDVASGVADVTFVEPAVAYDYMDANPGTIKQVENVEPVRAFATSYMIQQGSPEFIAALNESLERLHESGVVDEIIDRYEDRPGLFVRPEG